MLDAPRGLGCDHCEVGHPITSVSSRAGSVALCLPCTLLWFPGRTAEWFEERHTPFLDHRGIAKAAAIRKQLVAA